MGEWTSKSQSHVAYMRGGDFYGSEQSVVATEDSTFKIEFVDSDGNTTILKDDIPVQAGEVVDAMVMNCRALRAFYEAQLENAKNKGRVIFTPPQSHHDESIRPDPLSAMRSLFITKTYLKNTPLYLMNSASIQTTALEKSIQKLRACQKRNAQKSKPTLKPVIHVVRTSPWSTQTAASQTYTYPAM